MATFDPTDAAIIEDRAGQSTEIAALREAVGSVSSAGPTLDTIVAEPLEAPEAAAIPIPHPPIPLPLRNVSGTYVGVSGGFELDLRVDVDGARPMRRVSGDFVQMSGSTRTYFGSFIVDSPTITNTPAGEVIRGLGRFTFAAGAPVVQVTIPRRPIFQSAAPATVQFFTTANQPGATYVCNYSSGYFRTLTLQTERSSDLHDPVFATYNTGSQPSGGSARTLSVVSAYAEAGVQMVPVASGPVINVGEAGPDKLWSTAEMMASMKLHFSRYSTAPHWDMWQGVFWAADIPGLLGIMFDSGGRQGCTVFYSLMSGTSLGALRQKLFAHVHELGHAFNLMHSWQKSLAHPPGTDNPSALSWMNYPQLYPNGGTNAFWAAFPFQFIDSELVHIRHGFRKDVIPGGNPFTTGAAEIDPALMDDPIEDISGLEFTIAPSHGSHHLGEPVVINLRLASFDRRGRLVHPNLHPATKGVSIAISRPDGRAILFEPLAEHLVADEPVMLTDGKVLTESAYVGFGKGDLYFDQPGTYRVRAIYHAVDGSRVLSNVTRVRVKFPVTQEDNDVAELMLGEQQGTLLALRGSDDPDLAEGNAALETVIEKHGKHPVATYARYVHGINAARTFKIIDDSAPGRLRVRKADLKTAQSLLAAAAADATRLDNISKAQGLERLAQAQHAHGDTHGAERNEHQAGQLRAAHR